MSCYRNVLPFTAMVVMECVNVGLNTLFKAATMRGMCYLVFIFYANLVAAFVLLPAPFLSHRSRVLPPLNFSIMSKIVLLGLIGSSGEMMGYTGITFSSPALSSAISNLVPALTFIFAAIFRMENAALSSRTTQAKILGTIVSISGAFVVTLYSFNFWCICGYTDHSKLSSTNSNWVLGGLLLMAEYILLSLWYIVQTQIIKEYPSELTVIFFYNLCAGSIAGLVGLITVTDSSAWRLRPDIGLVSVVCSGLFGSFVNNVVHTWTLRLKGPVYVTMFKPLSMVIAVAMGVMFLGDTLHLGSIVGATIIAAGFYTVLWGKAKEEAGEDYVAAASLESPCSDRAPLLQNLYNRGGS